jgi:hypothetical protein
MSMYILLCLSITLCFPLIFVKKIMRTPCCLYVAQNVLVLFTVRVKLFLSLAEWRGRLSPVGTFATNWPDVLAPNYV